MTWLTPCFAQGLVSFIRFPAPSHWCVLKNHLLGIGFIASPDTTFLPIVAQLIPMCFRWLQLFANHVRKLVRKRALHACSTEPFSSDCSFASKAPAAGTQEACCEVLCSFDSFLLTTELPLWFSRQLQHFQSTILSSWRPRAVKLEASVPLAAMRHAGDLSARCCHGCLCIPQLWWVELRLSALLAGNRTARKFAKLFAKSQKVFDFEFFDFFDFSSRNLLECELFDFSTFRIFRIFRAETSWNLNFSTFRIFRTFRTFRLFDFSNFSNFRIFRAETSWNLNFSTFRIFRTLRTFRLFEFFEFSTFRAETSWNLNFSTFRIFRTFRTFQLFGWNFSTTVGVFSEKLRLNHPNNTPNWVRKGSCLIIYPPPEGKRGPGFVGRENA